MEDGGPVEGALSRRALLRGLGALGAGAVVAQLAGCDSGNGSTGTSVRAREKRAASTTTTTVVLPPGTRPNPKLPEGTDTLPQIEHIVVLMMENHSFDDHLGMLGRGDGFALDTKGRPRDANPDADGNLVRAFHMPSTCQLEKVPGQDWNRSHQSWADGRNDGFVKASTAVAMGYWDEADLPFYYGLARTFPLCDRWFGSVLAQTYPNRRFLIAGTAGGIVSTSTDALLKPPPPNGTIFERLDAHGITWANYYTDLPSVAIIPKVAVDAPTKLLSMDRYYADAAAGTLPSFCIVDPNFDHESEENAGDIRLGERFAANVINAAMHGKGWPKTLLIWTYDEHGGYYDHVPPPPAIRPDDIPPDIVVPPDYAGAYDRYGFRVPAVIVSPYARRNYVSHRLHDHTSVLKLIETKWNLPALTFRDANADDLLDSLDLRARPAFAAPPELAPAALENTPDTCVPGSPGGPIPPPDAVVPVSAAPGLRIGAS